MSDVRKAIRQKLIDAIPEIGGRCFEPHAADDKTEKPYMVVRQGTDTEDTPWTGFRRIVDIWPCVKRTSFASVDGLAGKATAALHNQLLTTSEGEVFTCQFMGNTDRDMVDDELAILTRGLHFAVLALQPVDVHETEANDPWLEALAVFTGDLLGATWQVYRNVWPLGYRRPSILWRLAGVETNLKSPAGYEIRKRFNGHVIGSTPNQQIAGVMFVIQGIGDAVKLPLDTGDWRYMTVKTLSGDYKGDALKSGQIALVLSRLTNRPAEEAPLMGDISVQGETKNGLVEL